MKNKQFAVISLVIGITLMLSFAVGGDFAEEYGVAIELNARVILASALLFLLGAGMTVFGVMRLTFVKRTEKILSLIEHHQSPQGVALDVLAKELKCTPQKVSTLVQELIHFGYINRIVIDYRQKKMIYLDSANVDGNHPLNFINLKCPTCGATNTVTRGKDFHCEYCSAKQTAPQRSQAVVLEKVGTADAEQKSLKENIRIGCGVPILIAMIDIFLIILFWLRDQMDARNYLLIGTMVLVPLLIIVQFARKMVLAIQTKRMRPIVARYLATVIHTRTPQGVRVGELAKVLEESPEITQKNLRFLIRHELLVGVTLDEKTGTIRYLNDGSHNRFYPVYCANCGGESVAIHGKSNRCPYCGNGV